MFFCSVFPEYLSESLILAGPNIDIKIINGDKDKDDDSKDVCRIWFNKDGSRR